MAAQCSSRRPPISGSCASPWLRLIRFHFTPAGGGPQPPSTFPTACLRGSGAASSLCSRLWHHVIVSHVPPWLRHAIVCVIFLLRWPSPRGGSFLRRLCSTPSYVFFALTILKAFPASLPPRHLMDSVSPSRCPRLFSSRPRRTCARQHPLSLVPLISLFNRLLASAAAPHLAACHYGNGFPTSSSSAYLCGGNTDPFVFSAAAMHCHFGVSRAACPWQRCVNVFSPRAPGGGSPRSTFFMSSSPPSPGSALQYAAVSVQPSTAHF